MASKVIFSTHDGKMNLVVSRKDDLANFHMYPYDSLSAPSYALDLDFKQRQALLDALSEPRPVEFVRISAAIDDDGQVVIQFFGPDVHDEGPMQRAAFEATMAPALAYRYGENLQEAALAAMRGE